MTEASSLLPQNATPWETAHELTDATRWAALDPSVITKVKDALQCDGRFLGVLGWERSVDLWFDDWSEEKKRHVVDRWFEYERLKGTVEGFRRAFALVGGELKAATLPPQGAWASEEWTEEERQRYLAQFQQVRIYPKVPVLEFQDGFFASTNEQSTAFADHVFATAYDVTLDTTIREARLYDPVTDAEAVLTRREVASEIVHVGTVYDFEDILLPAVADGLFDGDHLDDSRYLTLEDATDRVIRAEIRRPYGVALSRPQWSSVVPNARLITIMPDLVRERFDDAGAFLDGAWSGDFADIYAEPDVAWQHVYERFYLYDRSRDHGVTAGDEGCFADHAILGMTPFTAELKVEMPGQRKHWEFADFPEGFATDEDRTVLDRCLEATRAFKAARDTIYLDTKTRRARRFGDRVKFGDRVRFGDTVEA